MTFLEAVSRARADDAVWILGVILVLGCLAAAGYCAYRALWLASVLLLLVAIVAAVLLL